MFLKQVCFIFISDIKKMFNRQKLLTQAAPDKIQLYRQALAQGCPKIVLLLACFVQFPLTVNEVWKLSLVIYRCFNCLPFLSQLLIHILESVINC